MSCAMQKQLKNAKNDEIYSETNVHCNQQKQQVTTHMF
jgi:hypothetical protein